MSAAVTTAVHQSVSDIHEVPSGILQRMCGRGQHTGGGHCPACKGNKGMGVEAEAQAAPGGSHDLGPGHPIEGQTRRFMETRFGRDFSAVRVHTDAAAQPSAESLNARAYTTGSDIVFGTGEYAPQSFEGRHLLAHELTHVLQQRGHPGQQSKSELSSPGDPAEREADSVADAVMSGTRPMPGVFASPGARLLRAPPPPPPPPIALTITGSSELWWFDGETPPSYPVNQTLTASAGGLNGTFTWSLVTAAPPAILLPVAVLGTSSTAILGSLDASAARDDITVRVDFVGTAGGVGSATRDFTALAPDSLNHLPPDKKLTNATFVYRTEIHYSIFDQFRNVLPRRVPINEDFTALPTADFLLMNWRRGEPGSFNALPARWADLVDGETPEHFPTPVGPKDKKADTPVYHWPGVWNVGSHTIGDGRQVASVTWQKNLGFAEHT